MGGIEGLLPLEQASAPRRHEPPSPALLTYILGVDEEKAAMVVVVGTPPRLPSIHLHREYSVSLMGHRAALSDGLPARRRE